MISLRNISLSYGEVDILSNLSFNIGPGEVLGIIGDSGMGKTSILKIIAGLLDASSGTVLLEGKAIEGPSIKLVPGHEEIQLVNQDFELDVYQTVFENVQGKVLHLSSEDREELIGEVLELVELNDIRNRKAINLSGGEQQRLALARALICEPKCLLLDEPFVHVDQRLRFKIINYLLQLNEIRNTTIVLVSHDGAEMLGFAGRLIHLQSKGIVRDDLPLNVYYSPDDRVQGELLGIINQVSIDGVEYLFRPNEYNLDGEGLTVNVEFMRAINSGMFTLNYFKTANDETLILTSLSDLDSVISFNITKR